MASRYEPLEGQEHGEDALEPPASAEPAAPAQSADAELSAQPNELAEERAPLVRDAEAGEGSAAAVERDGVQGEEHLEIYEIREKKRPGCCARCCFALKEYKIRGFRLPQFLGLGASLVLPTADAWLDWSVIIKWYLDGDVHWAEAGLGINLVSGAISGLLLGLVLTEDANARKGMSKRKAYPLGVLIGLPGLAPVAMAALALYDRNAKGGPSVLKWFKAFELIFESLPQSVLQCAILSIRGAHSELTRVACC
eukprot:COSAG04_NODE_6135_length_1402_cov_1.195702_1_plen_252_part_10